MRLDAPDKDGVTLRKRLLHVEKSPHGVRDPRLDSETPVPMVAEHLWEWFWDLNSGRQSGMGHSPLSWRDIGAWAELSGNRPTRWEVSVIKAMDRVYLNEIAEIGKEK